MTNKSNEIKTPKTCNWYYLANPKFFNHQLSTKYCKIVDLDVLKNSHLFKPEILNNDIDKLITDFNGWEYLFKKTIGHCYDITIYYEFIGKCLYTGLYDTHNKIKLNTFKVGTNELIFPDFPYIFNDKAYFFDTYNKLLEYCRIGF